MNPLRRQTLIEQAAAHLREGFQKGRWAGQLPGVGPLAGELGVSKDTLRAALALLEDQGLIKSAGWGKRREIVTRRTRARRSGSLRIGILLREPLEQDNAQSLRLILGIRHELEAAGHICAIAPRSIVECGGSLRQISALVQATKADAWIVYGGTHEVLKWFVSQRIPALAAGGRADDLPIACTRTVLGQAIRDCVDALVTRGHQRIVLIGPDSWREPTLGRNATTFLDRLRHHGIHPHADFNVPDWTETAQGMQELLSALFHSTPPTALLLLEPSYTVAALSFLATRGLRVPEDVSIVSLLLDPLFHFRQPEISHFAWPDDVHVKRIMQWVASVAAGKPDHLVTEVGATFREGQTIAPAPAR